jgi:hypothetical protein
LLSRARYLASFGLLIAVLPGTTRDAEPERPPTPLLSVSGATESGAAAGAPTFRLGTAASPFGWSTAVGDFNADGRPDVIVADRASQWTRGTGYRLDFAISGEPAASLTFQTTEDAIGIRVADVDHDSDLDIVLASATSGQTIGVWLNDGAGHFTRSSIPLPASALLTPRTLDRRLPDGLLAASDLPSRRSIGQLAARARAPAPSTSQAAFSTFLRPFVSRLVRSGAVPRAPPASPFTFLRS